MSVHVPLEVIDEIEEQRDRERIAWRSSCRLARDRALEREMEAGKEHGSYPVVKATVGHGVVGDGRGAVSGWRERKESESSGDEGMVCVSDLLERKHGLEDCWGGPGEVKPLLDDDVPPGPGEEEEELLTDQYIHRRLVLLEEKIYRRGKDGWSREGEGKGGR